MTCVNTNAHPFCFIFTKFLEHVYSHVIYCTNDSFKIKLVIKMQCCLLTNHTLPCWLLVTRSFCVIDPSPLAGRVLLLAGSKCNWRNCELKHKCYNMHKYKRVRDNVLTIKHRRSKRVTAWINRARKAFMCLILPLELLLET